MPEATSNHTTVPTRRHFLTQAAVVAAGGSILALATISAAADTAATGDPLASGEPDPILAYTHQQIDVYADSVGEQAVAARAHTDLDTASERRSVTARSVR